MNKEMEKIMNEIKMQNAEFSAVNKLIKKFKAHSQTAVVDDDYPMVRHEYESALADLMKAMKKNGRFGKGNRYGLKDN